MQFMQFTAARADTGQVLPYAKVTVYLTGTATKAALFNFTGGVIGNPATADATGLVGVAAADGNYDAVITSADGLYNSPSILKLQIYDLAALAAGTGSLQIYDLSPAGGLFTDIPNMNIAATVGYIQTSGRTVLGSFPAVYVRDPIQTANSASWQAFVRAQSLDGTWWNLDTSADGVNVGQYGAVGDGVTDDYPSFLAARDSLATTGGRIQVLPRAYKLGTNLTPGARSIYWDISPDASFTGAGTGAGNFPYMNGNPAQLAVGPYIFSNSHQKSTSGTGAISALSVEMVQPSDYGAGQSIGFFGAARISAATATANAWASYLVGTADSTALGNLTVLELNSVNNSASAKVKGLAISGSGSAAGFSAVDISRSTQPWTTGIAITSATDGIVHTALASGRGAVFHAPSATVASVPGTAISLRQYANAQDSLFLQRSTDTASTGYFLRAVNAANSANIATLDTLGNLTVGDLTSSRTGAPTTGVVFLNNTADRYLYYDGTKYIMPLADLYVNGSKVYTANNITAGPLTYSTGTIASGGSQAVSSVTEGAAGDIFYTGRAYSGTKATGSAASNLGYGPAGYMFDLRYDTADAGADFVRSFYGRTVFGSSAAKGGRIGVLGEVYHALGATNTASANRNYVGVVGQANVDPPGATGPADGGTNTGAGSKGAYFGINAVVRLGAGSTNVFQATGCELNTYVKATASTGYLFGATIAGFNEIRGAVLDGALEIGGGTDNGYGPHVGWKYGIVFSNIHGGDPFASDSTLIGSFWTSGGARTITNGIDLSGFNMTGVVIQGAKMSLSESTLTLGANGAGVSSIVAGNGIANAAMIMIAKGNGSTRLRDGSGIDRVQVDNVVGLTLVPLATSTPVNNGDLAIQATSNTSLTFKFKGADGVVRTNSLTLA